jgi:DNA-binding NtrC family response regulator
LKNIAEQISVLSTDKLITGKQLKQFLPEANINRLPVLASSTTQQHNGNDFANEREILYKLFFDMKKDVTELKKMFVEILQSPSSANSAASFSREQLLHDYPHVNGDYRETLQPPAIHQPGVINHAQPVLYDGDIDHHEEVEESLNIMDKEKELIIKALKKHKGKRKDASSDLGISERTLYRKLKEYSIDE